MNLENKIATVHCVAWDNYVGALDTVASDLELTYTSRLVSGLLEYKGVYFSKGIEFLIGVGSRGGKVKVEGASDFEIVGDELIAYKGKSKIVHIPE